MYYFEPNQVHIFFIIMLRACYYIQQVSPTHGHMDTHAMYIEVTLFLSNPQPVGLMSTPVLGAVYLKSKSAAFYIPVPLSLSSNHLCMQDTLHNHVISVATGIYIYIYT